MIGEVIKAIVISFFVCFAILATNSKKKLYKHEIISLFFLFLVSKTDHLIYQYFFHQELYKLIIPELFFIFTLYFCFSLIYFAICKFFLELKKINYFVICLPFAMVALRYFLGWNQ